MARVTFQGERSEAVHGGSARGQRICIVAIGLGIKRRTAVEHFASYKKRVLSELFHSQFKTVKAMQIVLSKKFSRQVLRPKLKNRNGSAVGKHSGSKNESFRGMERNRVRLAP